MTIPFNTHQNTAMIIYNVTVKVNNEIAADWLDWLRAEHIPAMKATGCFTHATILRLLETDDADGPTYAVQYFAESRGMLNNYLELHAATLRAQGLEKWGAGFIAFRSIMEVVN
jgi:Domain of unknown function (DUF4286)